jgi:3D (Asp-Asp-Asp) domain-containing protein
MPLRACGLNEFYECGGRQWSAAAGTVAADVRHHPYGTQLFLPGYGWGRVEDDGGQTLGV